MASLDTCRPVGSVNVFIGQNVRWTAGLAADSVIIAGRDRDHLTAQGDRGVPEPQNSPSIAALRTGVAWGRATAER